MGGALGILRLVTPLAAGNFEIGGCITLSVGVTAFGYDLSWDFLSVCVSVSLPSLPLSIVLSGYSRRHSRQERLFTRRVKSCSCLASNREGEPRACPVQVLPITVVFLIVPSQCCLALSLTPSFSDALWSLSLNSPHSTSSRTACTTYHV